MNAIKPKNTEVGSFFLKAWVFAAARKRSFSVTPFGLFMCRICSGFFFFLEILEDFKEDVSVAITQMKPERCKKAEKEQEPHKILLHNSFSTQLSWALLTEVFPVGIARVGDSPDKASLSIGFP